MIDTAFLEAVRSPQIGIEMNSIEALLQTVANTGLATILTPRIARTSRNLVAVPIPDQKIDALYETNKKQRFDLFSVDDYRKPAKLENLCQSATPPALS
jgi:hypothetical protein